MKNIRIGIIGFGTVGTGVVRLLVENGDLLAERAGVRFEVKKIADIDIKRDRGIAINQSLLTAKAEEVLSDPEIDIVVELIGGIEPAKSFIMQALRNGKHVVTANKALISEHGPELFSTAHEYGRALMFEASAGGSIPIIKSIREGLVGNRFKSIYGILNGTANYILTRMFFDGATFNEALTYAQEKGYAEADPTLDISGGDTAHKLTIIASLAYGKWVGNKNISVEGITDITQMDIDFAYELGYTIKLLAIMKIVDERIELRVHPTLVPEETLLASVSDTYNAIFYQGDYTEKGLQYGRGAGERPTASAVVSDIVEIAGLIQDGIAKVTPVLKQCDTDDIIPFKSIVSRSYLRVTALDMPGVLAKIAGILGAHNISIASVIQKERSEGEGVPVVMMTHAANEQEFQQAVKEIDVIGEVKDKTIRIRVEDCL